MVLAPQKAWSNGKSALLVRVPAQWGSSLSVYLAEFLGFARLRPSTTAERDTKHGRRRQAAPHEGSGDGSWAFMPVTTGV